MQFKEERRGLVREEEEYSEEGEKIKEVRMGRE